MKPHIDTVDFSHYHGLDHWPFTPSCYAMPKGGGLHHVKLAWNWHYRDQVFRWFYLIRCRQFGGHRDVLYSVGCNPGKECWYCKRPAALTTEDIAQMKRSWPAPLHFSGGEDEMAVESPPE